MRTGLRGICWLALAIAVALATFGGSGRALAQTAPAVQSDPPRDAILTAPPRRIDLSFMDVVDPSGPATIRLVASDGRTIQIGPPRFDPNDPRHIAATIPEALPAGTYTALWSATFAPPANAATPGPNQADAATVRTGSFAFRVAPGAAGAAAPGGTWPTAWGVATRWLIWAGIALAAGGALSGLFGGAGPSAAGLSVRRMALVAAGGTIALLATLVQPLLLWMTAGAAGPATLGEAFDLMGAGWWTTLAATALLALVGLGSLATGFAARPAPRVLDLVPLALTIVAVTGLTVTGRLSAAPSSGPISLVSNLAHDWASLLLVAAIVAAFLARSGSGEPPLIWRGLAWLAAPAALIAIVTGAIDAGLTLPSADALGGSAWGVTLLVKALLALGLVSFAALGLRLARSKDGTTPFALAAGLGALVLLAGSTLTLMAAPGAPADPLAQLELAAPLPTAVPELGATPGLVHLTLQPALPGPNAATVRLTDAAGTLPAHLPAVQARFTPLDHAAPPATLAAPLDPANGAAAGAVDLTGVGWWAVDLTVTAGDGARVPLTLYFVLPDPNVAGAGPMPPSDPQAKAVFERGLTGMTSLKNVRFTQILGDGGGSVYASQSVVTTNPPAYEERSANATVIVADGQQWIKAGDTPWSVSPAASIPLPSTWGDAYTPVAGFQLGPVETIAGEPCQVVTFYHLNQVGRQWAPTWYAWWVGTDSGRVRREAMVSTRHYMIYDYSAFDEPATIEPPADANAPVGTPGP